MLSAAADNHLGSSLTEMCKHILNAQARPLSARKRAAFELIEQVSIRAPCCRKWFDCAECHEEKEDHELAKAVEMTFICKKCKKAFRKDMDVFEESDEYCPHCDNHFVLPAKTPTAVLGVEGEDARVDSRILKDERLQQKSRDRVIDEAVSERLG